LSLEFTPPTRLRGRSSPGSPEKFVSLSSKSDLTHCSDRLRGIRRELDIAISSMPEHREHPNSLAFHQQLLTDSFRSTSWLRHPANDPLGVGSQRWSGKMEAGIFRSSLHISPFFVTRTPRRRHDGVHGVEGGEGVVDTTSNRLQRVRPVRARVSGAAAGNR